MGLILTVVGARPQFIKAAAVSPEFVRRDIAEDLIHTGQHFDYNMSQAFFDELSIPEPSSNLGISGGTHAEMTARMLVALEREIIERKPDAVLLYGDTNSTLAGALAAAKLHIPIAHVEAGARTRSMTNPEEINRICADHVSTRLLACTQASLSNLVAEGLAERSEVVGDPMLDAFLRYSAMAARPELRPLSGGCAAVVPERYYYVTCHREENTGDAKSLEGILSALQELDAPAVYPVHPRNQSQATKLAATGRYGNVLFVEPVGYLESIWLVNHAEQIVTDSGGLQREAFFAGVKCTTVLDFEVWPETMIDYRNTLAKPERDSILGAMALPQTVNPAYTPFGDGHAAERIANSIEEMIGR